MRTTLLTLSIASGLSFVASKASAEVVNGVYEVKYESSANNCSTEYLKFARGDLKIEVKGTSMAIEIERVPRMIGPPNKSGKITAKSKSSGGHTAVAGLDGVFSVAGRVQNGLLSLVFVGEYHTAADRKPLCTQSWNISGTRKEAEPAPEKKK